MTYLSDEDYAFIYGRSVRMCVDLLIKDSSGKLFLTQRNILPYKGLWHLPGGAIRFKETLEDAANRIAEREFGCKVKILKHIGLCEIIVDDLDGRTPRHSNSIVVEAEIISNTPQVTKESKQLGYFLKLPANMHPYHEGFIKKHQLL